MCGISVAIGRDNVKLQAAVERMTDTIRHRGPDEFRVSSFDGCVMGHARLSVIDLISGSQPMASASGRRIIVFNGEIYNFRQLRGELELLGYKFRTSSDTEVILNAYDAWGSGCLDRFRGMFAFAIWDNQKRELFAARDLFGEKPFYFASAPDNVFLVSSEIKAIIAAGLIAPKIDPVSIDAFLALGYVPPDRSIYANIHTLAPGHFLYWKAGSFKITRYWQPILKERSITLDDAIQRTQELLRQAVARQTVADVPVGAFLSGGLDSSTIVALMQAESNKPVKTFSVGFGKYINELPFARAVAKKYKTEHYEIDLGTPDAAGMLMRMAQIYDEPFADSSNIPTYLISEFARKQVKVVLSGDGGDELFGGYSWAYPMLVKSGEVPRSLALWIILRSLSKLLRHCWNPLSLYSAGCGLAVRQPDMWQRQIMQSIYIKKEVRQKLWGKCPADGAPYYPGSYYQPPDGIKGANRGFYFDLTSYLPGDILVKVDRAAMAVGLETRAPFLDRDLVEFSLSLPVNLKVSEWKTKILLQKACADYWPKELQGRRKQGFGSPVDVWLDLPAVKKITERVFSNRSPLRALLPGVNEAYTKRRDQEAWMLLTLGLWLEEHGAN